MEMTMTSSQGATARMSGSYAPPAGVYDEMLSSTGAPRPHWQALLQSFRGLESDTLAARWDSGLRLLRDHGVTYNIHSGKEGQERPWSLDLAPLILPAAEWRSLERGVLQRARLLNMVLADLYAGSQLLLRDGFIPPALVYANPRFLRPCRGIRAPHDLYLHWYAVDLARAPDGQWRVLADHTHVPVGIGYALENRIVISRVLPDEFRESGAHRLAPFMHYLAESLRQMALHAGRSPKVVLLTPGPHDENYFEHAYLARHLGFTLAEAADLTVRDQRVFMKTLEGLQPVHVIIRGLDENICDPLELRDDASTGVAGLIEATRAGTVVLANALGSGLMESPAFQPFLPALCQHLLGEELRIPCKLTWWCGQAEELRHVEENLDSLILRPAFCPPASSPAFPSDGAEREAMLARFRLKPQNFVAQSRTPLSTAPVWRGQRLVPCPVAIRLFVAGGPYGLMVMPGALARVSPTPQDDSLLDSRGWGGKDTWVLAETGASASMTPALSLEWAAPDRGAGDLPSRAADNLFWLGRYAERLENTVRLGRCFLRYLMDETENALQRHAGVRLLRTLNLVPASLPILSISLEESILDISFDPRHAEGVPALIQHIRFAASAVRDRLSSDTWRILNGLEPQARPHPDRLPLAAALQWLNSLVLQTAAFSGMEMENMTRGHGWRFLDFGRRLERASNLVHLLHAAHADTDSFDSLLEALLDIEDSAITYRRLYATPVRAQSLMELLVADEDNPRSLAFQLKVLSGHAEAMPNSAEQATLFDERNLIQNLLRHAGKAELAELFATDPHECRQKQEAWFSAVLDGLAGLSDQLTHHYFSHTTPQVS
jgi:uncharacterized circularly permuted ATP-grasp superfamily protein/uncharacterized alpha-E superfamily protein